MPKAEPRYIVAEVSKSWKGGRDMPGTQYPGKALGQIFETVIAHNLERGYVLHSFSTWAVLDGTAGVLTETVLAVFDRTGP